MGRVMSAAGNGMEGKTRERFLTANDRYLKTKRSPTFQTIERARMVLRFTPPRLCAACGRIPRDAEPAQVVYEHGGKHHKHEHGLSPRIKAEARDEQQRVAVGAPFPQRVKIEHEH